MEITQSETTPALIGDFVPGAVIPSVFDKIEQPEKVNNAFDNSIIITVKLRVLGTRRKVSTSHIEVEADKEFIHVSKDILESDTLVKIKKLDGNVRSYINRHCLPYIMKNGMYLLPITSLEKVDNKLLEFKTEREQLVNQFISEYESIKSNAEPKLGALFNPQDYPGVDQVRSMFSMDVRYVTFSTPGKLKEIAPAIWQREIDNARKDVSSQVDEIKGFLRVGLSELTNHLVDKLSNKDGGGRKVFRDSLVNNFREFLDDFNTKNIVNDTELAALVEKAKSCLDGVDPKSLRDSDVLREDVKTKFAAIKDTLDTMLESAPKRQFDFTDDGE